MSDLLEELTKAGEPKEIVSFYLDKETVERMNTLCKQLRISKSKFVRESLNHAFSRLEKGLNEGNVYFFRGEGTNFFKIGKSKDVEKRKKELQGGCPFTLHTFTLIKCFDMDALEKAFHEYFQQNLKSGEWFELSEKDIEWVKNQEYLRVNDLKKYIY